MVVIKEGSDEDNGIVVFIENQAIMQKFVKRIKKR